MEDGRYRTRFYEGVADTSPAVNLVSGTAGTVLYSMTVKHPAIEVCLLGADFEAGVTGPVAPGDEAVLGLYRLPAGGGTEVDTGVRFTVPAAGVAARNGVVVDTNSAAEPGDLNDRPVFYRGDRVRIKLEEPGATTAQAARPYFCYRELKYGRQEGPS